jgi:hypothetical protein
MARHEGNHTREHENTDTALKRRGILAAAAAVVAGIAVKQTAQPVAASASLQIATAETSGTLNGPVVGPTFIYDTNAGPTSQEPVLIVSCNNGTALAGLRGTTFGIVPGRTLGPLPPEKCGVYGDTSSDVGVLGATSQSGVGIRGRILLGSSSTDTVAVDGSNASSGIRGIGVRGQCDAGFGVGVQGLSSSYFGVQGSTDNGIGVVGDVKAGSTGTSNIGVLGRVGGLAPNSQPNTVGVYGQNLATGTNGIGVEGVSDLASGIGVKGVSGSGSPIIGSVEGSRSGANGNAGVLGKGSVGPGVQGQSVSGHGLIGYTSATDGHAALIGYAQTTGSIGLIGVAPGSAGHWAGVFYGDVHINGTMSAPTAGTAVTHPDGSSRLLQSVASPEGWFEDFGKAKLVNGTAHVPLDPDFAALVHTDDYHVFLTEYDDNHNLYATKLSASGFTVQAKESVTPAGMQAPTKAVSGTFGYRVVAKRADNAGGRLAKVASPPGLKPVTPFVVPESPAVKPPIQKP